MNINFEPVRGKIWCEVCKKLWDQMIAQEEYLMRRPVMSLVLSPVANRVSHQTRESIWKQIDEY